MAMLGGGKLFCWLASLLMSNIMTATFFLLSQQTNTGQLCQVYNQFISPNFDNSLNNHNLNQRTLKFNSHNHQLPSTSALQDSHHLPHPVDHPAPDTMELLRGHFQPDGFELDVNSSTNIVHTNCSLPLKNEDCRVSQFTALLNVADRTLCLCDSNVSVVDQCRHETPPTPTPSHSTPSPPSQSSPSSKTKPSYEGLPRIFAITPTYPRYTQKVDLTSLCQTLMNVPQFTWIVIEDSQAETKVVTELLARCDVDSVHLNIRTPPLMRPRVGQSKNPASFSRGVQQRNMGLDWIKNHCSETKCNGVVYFMDDDNKYDLRLFQEIRKTEGVSVFPVGFSGGLKFEGPICEDGKPVKWQAVWDPQRPFPIDMAGFAMNVDKILEHRAVKVGMEANGQPTRRGYLETSFLEHFASRETVHCMDTNREMYVWHVKTQKPTIVYEGKHPSDRRYIV